MKRDGREGEWHERRESAGEAVSRLHREQTKSGAADHIRLKGKKELAAAGMSLLVLNSIPTNKQKKESSPKVTAKNGGYNPPKWTYTLNELY